MKTDLAHYAAQLRQRQRREIAVEPKVMSEKDGIIRYVASDETMDHAAEVIRINGWRFTHFAKNSPFVDSHDYSSIGNLLGKVIGYAIEGGELVEDVQYALTEQGNTFADWAFKMARDKFIKAVSVGCIPEDMATRWDSDQRMFVQQINELRLDAAAAARLRCVYITQEQIELSQCLIGCNPNALQKSLQSIAGAYKAGTIDENAVDKLSALIATSTKNATPAADSADAGVASPRTKLAVLAAIQAQL